MRKGIALAAVLAVMIAVSGCTMPSQDCREFSVERSGDIGTASTVDGAMCSTNPLESCVIIHSHWESIEPVHMTGTYVMQCRCCPIGG
jgi:hypothetical protein